MSTPDKVAKSIVELINSRPRSPFPEEIQAVLRTAYLAVLATIPSGPNDNLRNVIEKLVEYRTDLILALINARPRSPTFEEIRSVLTTPQDEAERSRTRRALARH
jgi:hypothetical protein